MKIAVIGSGITGLSCGYLLSHSGFDVTLYEKEQSIGIGAHHFPLETNGGQKTMIDIPHRVISPRYYHNMIRLLSYAGVKFKKEDFSASFSLRDQDKPFLAWTTCRIGYFSFPMFDFLTIIRHPMIHIKLLLDALFFYKTIRKDIHHIGEMTTYEYFHILKSRGFSIEFIDHMILPFLSIVNTCSFEHVFAIPAKLTMEYLISNSFSLRHKYRGFFRPIGGVNQIIDHLSSNIKNVKTNCSVKQVYKVNHQWAVMDQAGDVLHYDHVVIATQSNHALQFVKDLKDEIKESLSKVQYTKTIVMIHTDEHSMPSNKGIWKPGHVIVDHQLKEAMATLWMNQFQPEIKQSIFQTTNPIIDIDKKKIIKEITFERPLINQKALDAMGVISKHNGYDHLWFCGSYTGNGLPLLEAGVISAMNVAEGIGAHIPKFSDDIIVENKEEKIKRMMSLPNMLKLLIVCAPMTYFFISKIKFK